MQYVREKGHKARAANKLAFEHYGTISRVQFEERGTWFDTAEKDELAKCAGASDAA